MRRSRETDAVYVYLTCGIRGGCGEGLLVVVMLDKQGVTLPAEVVSRMTINVLREKPRDLILDFRGV